jgi:hypothetical protein
MKRASINRRAFLRTGAVAVGLPFLEGLPARSAWAAGSQPVFSLFIVTACGVVGSKFFPSATGALTSASLAAETDKATSLLAPHAGNLLFLTGIDYPMARPTNCGHGQGSAMSLTAMPAGGGGSSAYSTGISADMVIAQTVNPDGADPLTLYAGNRNNGYIAERISFKAGGQGQVRAADDNPYTLYSKLIGLSDPGSAAPEMPAAAAELLASRKSVNDLVRAELEELRKNPALSADDRLRLQEHFDAIRDTEVTLGRIGEACTKDGISVSEIEAFQQGLAFKMDGMIEQVAKLQLELVALAFACNLNRVATLQHGDGTDQTRYAVASNADLGWPFHHLSHRIPSDSGAGSNPVAEQAHAEIDVLRMQTLLHGLDRFAEKGLLDKSIVMWTNHVADGPTHSFEKLPFIIAGDGGGYLKQGQFIDAGGARNARLFNTLIGAAVRDTQAWANDFGDGGGTLDVIQAG